MFTGCTVSCATATVLPAIVNDPVRAAPGFALTDTATLPLSVPAAPAVTVMNESLLRAVHAHNTALDVTVSVAVPPGDPNERLVGVTVSMQAAGATGESLLQAAAPTTRHKAPVAARRRSKDMGAAECNG